VFTVCAAWCHVGTPRVTRLHAVRRK
jgi:hypothetical protein